MLCWETNTCVTSPRSVMGERLHNIAEFAVAQVETARRELVANKRHAEMCLGMENFSFNSKFGLPVVGQVVGAIRAAIWTRCGQEDITMHAIGNIKRLAVPNWPGYSREAWAKAGYAKSRFKRSNPTTIAVASGLSIRFGIHLMNEHEVDAMVVAIAAANKAYGIKPEMWRKDG